MQVNRSIDLFLLQLTALFFCFSAKSSSYGNATTADLKRVSYMISNLVWKFLSFLVRSFLSLFITTFVLIMIEYP